MTTIKLLFIYESSLTVLHLRAAISLVGSSGGPHKYLFFLLKKFVGPIIGPTRIYQSHLRVLWNSFDLFHISEQVFWSPVSQRNMSSAKRVVLHKLVFGLGSRRGEVYIVLSGN